MRLFLLSYRVLFLFWNGKFVEPLTTWFVGLRQDNLIKLRCMSVSVTIVQVSRTFIATSLTAKRPWIGGVNVHVLKQLESSREH